MIVIWIIFVNNNKNSVNKSVVKRVVSVVLDELEWLLTTDNFYNHITLSKALFFGHTLMDKIAIASRKSWR